MINLIVRDGYVVNCVDGDINLSMVDADCEVVEWDGDISDFETQAYEPTEDDISGVPPGPPVKDPRTQEQKDANAATHRARQREVSKPTIEEALAMLAHDLEKVTPTYQAAIAAANALYPEP